VVLDALCLMSLKCDVLEHVTYDIAACLQPEAYLLASLRASSKDLVFSEQIHQTHQSRIFVFNYDAVQVLRGVLLQEYLGSSLRTPPESHVSQGVSGKGM
jgi:hypothetical protein